MLARAFEGLIDKLVLNLKKRIIKLYTHHPVVYVHLELVSCLCLEQLKVSYMYDLTSFSFFHHELRPQEILESAPGTIFRTRWLVCAAANRFLLHI
jgi:hypothetical protein